MKLRSAVGALAVLLISSGAFAEGPDPDPEQLSDTERLQICADAIQAVKVHFQSETGVHVYIDNEVSSSAKRCMSALPIIKGRLNVWASELRNRNAASERAEAIYSKLTAVRFSKSCTNMNDSLANAEDGNLEVSVSLSRWCRPFTVVADGHTYTNPYGISNIGSLCTPDEVAAMFQNPKIVKVGPGI